MPCEVEVRFFASLAERAGCSAETLSVGDGTDVAGLWRELVLRHPRLAEIGFRPLAACDREWVPWDRPLDGVSEVAFVPPLSGG